MIRKLLRLVGIFWFIIGAHGIYAWMHRNDWQLAGDLASGEVSQGDLFFRFSIPVVDEAVYWMSYEAVQSIFMPILVLVSAVLLWKFSPHIHQWLVRLFGFHKKKKPCKNHNWGTKGYGSRRICKRCGKVEVA